MAKRRGPGEGSIFPHKKNGVVVADKWEVWCPASLGVKRTKRIVSGPFRRAVEKLDQLKEEQRGLGIPTSANQTTGEYLTYWLERVAKPRVRESTYYSYASFVRTYLIPNLGKLRLDKLAGDQGFDHINNMLEVLRKRDLAPRTRQEIRAVLIVALKDGVRLKKLRYNWAKETAPIRLDRRERVVLENKDQVGRYLDACLKEPHGILYALMLALGLRRGEVLGLEWSDFNEQKRTLTLNRSLKRGYEGRATLGDTKTAGSTEVIPLIPFAFNLLIEQRRRQQEARTRLGDKWVSHPEWRGHDFIFTSIDTRHVLTGVSGDKRLPADPISPNTITMAHAHFCKKYGFPHMPLHGVRRSTATLLVHAKVPPHLAQKIMRHKSIEMTLNVYAQVPDIDVLEGRNLFGDWLESSQPTADVPLLSAAQGYEVAAE